jgi:hypothetical protein
MRAAGVKAGPVSCVRLDQQRLPPAGRRLGRSAAPLGHPTTDLLGRAGKAPIARLAPELHSVLATRFAASV